MSIIINDHFRDYEHHPSSDKELLQDLTIKIYELAEQKIPPFYSKHCQERQYERNITNSEIHRILQHGVPHPKCGLQKVNNGENAVRLGCLINGRPLEAVVIPRKDHLFIVTTFIHLPKTTLYLPSESCHSLLKRHYSPAIFPSSKPHPHARYAPY
jgi:hypothetical protein